MGNMLKGYAMNSWEEIEQKTTNDIGLLERQYYDLRSEGNKLVQELATAYHCP
jgi:hypothetical protein